MADPQDRPDNTPDPAPEPPQHHRTAPADTAPPERARGHVVATRRGAG